jgi:hypothetical protein
MPHAYCAHCGVQIVHHETSIPEPKPEPRPDPEPEPEPEPPEPII